MLLKIGKALQRTETESNLAQAQTLFCEFPTVAAYNLEENCNASRQPRWPAARSSRSRLPALRGLGPGFTARSRAPRTAQAYG